MNPGSAKEEIEGIKTIEPAFGIEAKWIESPNREKAELNGYTVVEPPAVLITHLMEVLKSQAHRILGRQASGELFQALLPLAIAVRPQEQENGDQRRAARVQRELQPAQLALEGSVVFQPGSRCPSE